MFTRNWRAVTVILLIAATACSGKKGEGEPTGAADMASTAQQQAESATPGAETSSDAPKVQLNDLGALADLIVAEANDLPRADFDPAALASKLGKDPQAHFEWVRDHTWWAPYRGLLRGSKGVMLDRVGSSLDRAVLLGDLLRRAGFTVRLAHAQLSETRARELLAEVRPIPGQRSSPAALGEMPVERRRAIAALVPNYDKLIEELRAKSKRTEAEAGALVQSQSEALLGAIPAAARTKSDDQIAAIDAISDHWWVERNDAGKWLTMDVLLPDARPGEAIAAAAAASAWPADEAWPSIPDTEWHSVQMRVVVERYAAGDMKESTVLESKFRPAELVDRPIRFGHIPLPWRNGLSADVNLDSFKEAALAVRAWLPFFQVGDKLISQAAFTNEGGLEAAPSKLTAVSQASGTEQVGDFASALGGFGGDEVGPAATAEWLDYEIHVPGSRPEQLRRPVFDLLGPARRASKFADFNGNADLPKLQRFEALYSDTSVLFQVSDFTDEFVTSLLTDGVVAAQGELHALSRERDTAQAGRRAQQLMWGSPQWGPLANLVLWRSTLAGPTGDTFPNRPNVLNYRVTQPISVAEKPMRRYLIDIAANSTGTRPGTGRNPFEVRVRQGVADTVAEMVAVGSNPQMAENTASIFARLASENSRGLLIAAEDLDAAKALPWPEDEAARVAADVGAGFMTLVPRQAVQVNGEEHVGWWRVDPDSGETIGVMDSGWHAATVEDAEIQSKIDEIEAFLAENPVSPLNAPPGSAQHAAWQARNGGLCVLHQALRVALSLAWVAGYNVSPRQPLPLGCTPIG